MLFQFVQIIYWLALSTWFGGVLFVAIAAPVIFRTIRRHNPILPAVLSVNLEGQHGTLLAGDIVGNLLARLAHVSAICAAFLLASLIAQFFLIDLTDTNLTFTIFRWVLFGAAGGVVIYHYYVVWPRISLYRQQYIDHADEPDVANPARDQFDREHRRSVTLLQALLFLLLGMILFSASITPRRSAAQPLRRPSAPATLNNHGSNPIQQDAA
jgi:hypothetical protein